MTYSQARASEQSARATEPHPAAGRPTRSAESPPGFGGVIEPVAARLEREILVARVARVIRSGTIRRAAEARGSASTSGYSSVRGNAGPPGWQRQARLHERRNEHS